MLWIASSPHGRPLSSETEIPAAIAHMPVFMSDTSTTSASPVRSRWNSAAEIPPAIVIAPMVSPYAGAGIDGISSLSRGLMLSPLVPRYQ